MNKAAQRGLALIELLVGVTIAVLVLAGISGIVSMALNARQSSAAQNDTLQQARFAMQLMVNAVSKTRRLMIPLGENSATAWSESVRNVLAVTLDPTLDRDRDGWADANNDKDFLDVNHNGIRDVGEPERIDEDVGNDNTNDGAPGIIGIDDDGDGLIDEGLASDNDEDGVAVEDSLNGIDDDGDGSIDEDMQQDMNQDIAAGIKNFDDDYDGTTDEGFNDDDDEDGLRAEDWLDPVVFYLDGTTLMERMPNINPVNGADFSASAIAENVSQFVVKRIAGGDGKSALVDITLTLTPPSAAPVTLHTLVKVSGGL